jgi:Fic family protein
MFDKASGRAGELLLQVTTDETYYSFLPKKLPPDPPIEFNGEINRLLESASRALGRLDGISYLLPDPDIFIYQFVRKEAVLSSQIEGTQTTLVEFLEAERDLERKTGPIEEVSNYISAMNYGLERLDKLPISSRLIKEIHRELITGTRGDTGQTGEFRNSQNWIGGTRPGNASFVPPPFQNIVGCMGDLEIFINDDKLIMSTLIKAGLAHAQFETIHPFPDGNGRLGRLLITFILVAEGILKNPLLYLSLHFKNYRDEYYNRLNAIREHGDWEGWLKFYLEGVWKISDQAVDTARRIVDLMETDKNRIRDNKMVVSSALRVHELFFHIPVLEVKDVATFLEITPPTARKAVSVLEEIGIVNEFTGKKRNKRYKYGEYIDIIIEGTGY